MATTPPPLPRTPGGARRFFDAYTQGLSAAELERLFTRDTPDAYRLFARNIDTAELAKLPRLKRVLAYARLLFLAFTLKLSPARRALYGIALLCTLLGLLDLFSGVHWFLLPHPVFVDGTLWLIAGFALVNLLVLLEVADRFTLKSDLEIARDIQQSMLPAAAFQAPGLEAFGITRPANTVGGDFYDIIPLRDGRVLLALGDVAGKGSPAALLMALLLAMLRTLVDEGFEAAELMSRLNTQVLKHAPRSRFVTLFMGTLDPASGRFDYVNAGQNPPLLRRASGRYERLREGGIALGMFEGASYAAATVLLQPGDVIAMYSDGVTEAEDPSGNPFDEAGLQRVMDSRSWGTSKELGWATIAAIERHTHERRLLDDLTVLVMRRLHPIPTGAVAGHAVIDV